MPIVKYITKLYVKIKYLIGNVSTGGYLTITDANLVLGRIEPEYFPSIFGDTQDQPLDKEASMKAFELLTTEVTT